MENKKFQTSFSKEFMTFTPTDDELDNLAKIEGAVIDEEGSFTKEYNECLYLYVRGELTAKVHKIAQPTPNFPSGGVINKKESQK